jgi:ferritin
MEKTMLISKKLNQAINTQVGRELEASHQYLSIAAYFEGRHLKKFAELFRKQSTEEREHAEKFVQFILDGGGEVVIPAVAAPKSTFTTAEEAVSLSLNWEKEVTQQIYHLVDIAIAEKEPHHPSISGLVCSRTTGRGFLFRTTSRSCANVR